MNFHLKINEFFKIFVFPFRIFSHKFRKTFAFNIFPCDSPAAVYFSYIKKLWNTESSYHTFLLILNLTESDLFQADLIFINDPRPCKRFLCVSCIRHKHRRASLCFPLFYFYRLQ